MRKESIVNGMVACAEGGVAAADASRLTVKAESGSRSFRRTSFRLVILIILAAEAFFNPFQLISQPMQKALFIGIITIALVYGLKNGLSLRNVKYPGLAYLAVLFGITTSVFMSAAFHQQTLKQSLVTTAPYFFSYLTFFVFMKLNVSRRRTMSFVMLLLGVSTLVYFINLFHVPFNVFGDSMLESEDMTRGIIRLPVPYILLYPVTIFYAINRWLESHKRKWLLVVAWCGTLVVLSVTRQVILFTALLGLMFVFQRYDWKRKLMLIVGVVAVVVWVLPMIPIYNTMIELSESQKDDSDMGEENVRITAARYYGYENQTNALSPVFGNGMPSFGVSKWGVMMDSETQENGCFWVDIGWIGFYWLYGGIATIGMIVMFVRALMRKKNSAEQYINYSLWFLILVSIASGPPVYYHQIVIICLMWFMALKPHLEESEKPDRENVENSTDNTELQQCGRYPQLSAVGGAPQLGARQDGSRGQRLA